jgi:hypothetical protein
VTDWSRSVIQTAEAIHGDVCGSGDPLPNLAELVDWLDRRVESGWEVRTFSEYDNAARELGRAAVRYARRR